MESCGKPMHVVMLPFVMHGHLIPALLLAHRLDDLGFKVTYVCPEYRIKHVKNQAKARGCDGGGVQFRTLKGTSPSENIILNGKTGNQQQSKHDSFNATQWFVETNEDIREEFTQLIRELNESSFPPCCIIGDNFFSWTQDVADEFKLPRLVMYPSPAQTLAVVFHLKNLLKQGKYPIKLAGQHVQVPGIAPAMHPMDLSTPTWETSPKYFQDFYIKNAFRIHEAAGILCNTFAALEPDVCSALTSNKELNPNLVPFLPAGPFLPQGYLDTEFSSDEENLVQEFASVETIYHTETPATYSNEKAMIQVPSDDKLLQWLNKQSCSSVLYVSFGSFPKASSLEHDDLMRKLALGVEASNHKFLWVLPTGGDVKLPCEFLWRTQDMGLVVQGWVNQLLVLSHPAVGGFLSHCGWNSTIESISRGIPMVLLPQYAEQRGNARLLSEKLEIGVWIDNFSEEDVQMAVCQVMDPRGSFRKRGLKLRYEAGQAALENDKKMVDFITKCINIHTTKKASFV